ncbi:MAG: type transport system permease protein [Frankiaceae bacterium]|jgi:ABC-type transport system involved in multi-copper enzyme maturation permease subunit|nr:type transport system permease protein [Frankiaceae bacterium]
MIGSVRAIWVLALWAIRESVRRRVFVVVALLTAGFLALFGLGCTVAFAHNRAGDRSFGAIVDAHELAGATLNGLAMFAILFLGSVLATFLTLSVVRGDAEAGLLQPLVVRPVGRAQVLLARWLAAATVCAAYVALVDVAVLLTLQVSGDWQPAHAVSAGLLLALAVAVLAGLCVLGSVLLSSIANGIAAFMLLGAGMFAGLLGQVGHGINNPSLEHTAHLVSWGLPFEALYQDALARTTAGQAGTTRFLVNLGPFGGGHEAGSGLLLYVAGYLALVGVLSVVVTSRRDL